MSDDLLAVDELKRRGIAVTPAVWNDPLVEWTDFDAVIVRSCWDYHLDPAGFLDWIRRLEAARLWNPPSILRWNLDKSYLRELERRGVPIVPTAWIERGHEVDLHSELVKRGWADAVVKPTISLSAHETWITSLASSEYDSSRAREVLRGTG